MPSLIKAILILTFSFTAFSCASRLKTPEGVPEISLTEYQNIMRNNTQKVEVYDGLYNILTIEATWLDSKVSEAGLSHSARLSQWNEQTYREEREKRVIENAGSTRFFVSFFTPERKHSDLTRSKNLWKIYLEVNGQRYEGKVSRVKQLFSEIQVMYPQHNRWSTPYMISFPVATALVEGKPATLTFTGAVGSAQLNFLP